MIEQTVLIEHDQVVMNPYNPNEQKKQQENTWQSCCLRTDKNAVVYLGQLGISLVILVFSGAMLIKAEGSCEESSPYIGLISFILGKVLSSVITSH